MEPSKDDKYLCSIWLSSLLTVYDDAKALRLVNVEPDYMHIECVLPTQNRAVIVQISEYDAVVRDVQELLDSMHGNNIPYKLKLKPRTKQVDIFYAPHLCNKHWQKYGTLPREPVLRCLLHSARSAGVLFCATQEPVKVGSWQPPIDKLVCPLQIEGLATLTPDFRWISQSCYPAHPEIPCVPLSCILTQANCPITSVYESIQTSGIAKRYPRCSKLYVDSILCLDHQAPRKNPALFTVKYVQSHRVLRIHPEDYAIWTCATPLAPTSVDDVDRLLLRRCEVNTALSIPKHYYHWKAVCLASTSLVRDVPYADWYFAIFQDPLFYSLGTIPVQEFHTVISTLFGKLAEARMPELYLHCHAQNTWKHEPLCSKFAMSRSLSSPSTAEKKLAVGLPTAKSKALHAFGFSFDPKTHAFTEEEFYLQIYKRNGILESAHIDKCLKGFAMTNAQALLTDRPTCTICYASSVDTLLDSCGHVFCKQCLVSCLQADSTQQMSKCPSCRATFTELEMTTIVKSSARHAKEIQLTREKQINSVTKLPGSLVLIVPCMLLNDTVLRFSHRADVTVLALDAQPRVEELSVCDHLIFTSNYIGDFTALSRVHTILQHCARPTTTVHLLLSTTEQDTMLHRTLLELYEAKEDVMLDE